MFYIVKSIFVFWYFSWFGKITASNIKTNCVKLCYILGNPYPPVIPKQRETKHLLTNILLSAAGRDFYKEQKEQQHREAREQSTSSDRDTNIINKSDETIEESENVVINTEASKESDAESGNTSATR